MLNIFQKFQKSLIRQRGLVKYFFRKNKPNPEPEKEQNQENEQENNSKEKENKDNKDNKDENENKNDEKKDEQKNKKDSFGYFNLSKGTPMIKEDAYKIMNFTENDELTSELIMERYEKYFIINDPSKGGSYYLQNKIFYAKEFLMKDFPKSENKSKYDLDNPVEDTGKDEKKGYTKDEKI